MPGPTPKAQAVRRNTTAPSRGDWTPAAGFGWQHGDTPAPPDGLKEASLEAWSTWMASWVAAFWTPTDLPGLRTMVRLYDQVERGEFQRTPELRLQMDNYGLTPKGKQDRRWAPPASEDGGVAQVKPIRKRQLKAV